MIKTYSQLISFNTFDERLDYLVIGNGIGEETFGCHRYLNQIFYKSDEWLEVRDYVMDRDNCCDLAMPGYEIYKYILIHHINPITKQDIIERNPILFDPENLVCCTKRTHNYIHYGYDVKLSELNEERAPFDMCPWRQ